MDTRATVILASVPAHNRFALFKKLRDGHHLHRQAMGCHWIIIRLVFKPGPRMAALPSISSHGHGIYRDPPNSLHGIHDLPFSHQPKERHDFLPAPSHFRHCPMARVSMLSRHPVRTCLVLLGTCRHGSHVAMSRLSARILCVEKHSQARLYPGNKPRDFLVHAPSQTTALAPHGKGIDMPRRVSVVLITCGFIRHGFFAVSKTTCFAEENNLICLSK